MEEAVTLFWLIVLLVALCAFTGYLMLHWPLDDSDTTFREEAAEVFGLIRGLAALAWWALTALPRMVLAASRSRREVTR